MAAAWLLCSHHNSLTPPAVSKWQASAGLGVARYTASALLTSVASTSRSARDYRTPEQTLSLHLCIAARFTFFCVSIGILR